MGLRLHWRRAQLVAPFPLTSTLKFVAHKNCRTSSPSMSGSNLLACTSADFASGGMPSISFSKSARAWFRFIFVGGPGMLNIWPKMSAWTAANVSAWMSDGGCRASAMLAAHMEAMEDMSPIWSQGFPIPAFWAFGLRGIILLHDRSRPIAAALSISQRSAASSAAAASRQSRPLPKYA